MCSYLAMIELKRIKAPYPKLSNVTWRENRYIPLPSFIIAPCIMETHLTKHRSNVTASTVQVLSRTLPWAIPVWRNERCLAVLVLSVVGMLKKPWQKTFCWQYIYFFPSPGHSVCAVYLSFLYKRSVASPVFCTVYGVRSWTEHFSVGG